MKTLIILCLIIFSPPTKAAPKKVLVVLSGENQLMLKNNKIYRTGFYLNELMLPVAELLKNNYKLTFATPKGNPPSLDRGSDDAKYFTDQIEYTKIKKLLASLKITNTKKSPIIALSTLKDSQLNEFAGIFVPGGHAPMIDLAFSNELGRILKHFNSSKKPTALICHGPIALLAALAHPRKALKNKVKEDWLYKGYKMTVFSNLEEEIAEKSKLNGKVPYSPENALRNAGGILLQGATFQNNVIKDRELITAQNPGSDRKFTELFLESLGK